MIGHGVLTLALAGVMPVEVLSVHVPRMTKPLFVAAAPGRCALMLAFAAQTVVWERRFV